MEKMTVAQAESLVDELFDRLPRVVLDFVAHSWRAAVAAEASNVKAMATVIDGDDDGQNPRCIRLRAGETNILRAPFRDGLYVVLDGRELPEGLRGHLAETGRVLEPEGLYEKAGAPWAVGVALTPELLASNLDQFLDAHRKYVRAVSGRRPGARFADVEQNAVATVLSRHGRALERQG